MYKKLIIVAALLLSGCGKESNYAMAYQLPPIKFPPHAMPVSNRYDIPPIATKECHIIEKIVPPYYDEEQS